jgi:eukaryotic-like serine/threonine-protein kinase
VIGLVVGGRYSLTERLGSGATSSVWRATDEVTGLTVAVKLLRADASESPAALARFEREARLLARVHSPNVVALRDRDERDERPFLVFDLVHGSDLRERLRQDGTLPISEAVAVAVQIANGLAAAHAKRLVHRDLKPGNVLLADDGRVKVADFGIARALEEPGLTQPGRVVGTGEYIAPEQALGRAPDPRGDLYSLGVVLYEMLAGRPPFRGAGFAEVAAKHLNQPPPPLSDARRDVPDELAALVAALLAKDPQDRPQTATSVRDTLRRMLVALAGDRDRSAFVAMALDESADGDEPSTGEWPVDEDTGEIPLLARRVEPVEAAAWEELTPASMEYPALDTTLLSSPYRIPASAQRDSGSLRWLAVIALGVALAVAAVVIATAGSSDTTGVASASTHTTTTSPTRTTTAAATTAPVPAIVALHVAQAMPYDPYGDRVENNDQAPFAIDGDPTTSWSTEVYHYQNLANGKGGVGLVLQLLNAATVRGVTLRTTTPGYTVTVYTSTQLTAPNALPGWTKASAATVVASNQQVITLTRPRHATLVLLWITQLAPDPTNNGFSAKISEAQPTA